MLQMKPCIKTNGSIVTQNIALTFVQNISKPVTCPKHNFMLK